MLPPLRPSSKSSSFEVEENGGKSDLGFAYGVWDSALLVSPFFFWGTTMVAMKEVLPKAGPFFVSSVRLILVGVMVIVFAAARGRKQPSGTAAWVWILLFGVVDSACFQVHILGGNILSSSIGGGVSDSGCHLHSQLPEQH